MNMNKKQVMKLSPLVGAVVLALSAPLAMAAVTAPAAGSLPGAFVTNNSAVTYSAASGATNAATITVPSSGPVVLQWGGAGDISAPTTIPAPSALTTNAGFDIGAGGTLTLAGSAGSVASTTPVLINDITGNPSQIYGSFSVAQGSTVVPVFIANANGVIVGSGATINSPSTISLVGYAQDPGAFTGGVTVNSATATNDGTVSIMPGASVTTGGYLLVAGGGNVNVGVAPTSTSLAVLGGSAFTVGSTGTVTAGGTINTSAVVNFDNVSGTIIPTLVDAAGAVNVAASALVNLSSATTTIGGALTNAGNVTLPSALTVASFLNNGIAVVAGTSAAASITASAGNITNNGALSDTTSATSGFNLSATGAGGSVVNNGAINVATSGTLGLHATSGGTVTNNGIINFEAFNATTGASSATNFTQGNTNYLNISAQNVNMYGVVNQATAANATPTALYLNATGGINAIAGASIAASTSGGVLNFGTTIVSVSDQHHPDLLQGDAVRILSGRFANRNIFNQGSNGVLNVSVGSGAVKNPAGGNYGYNLSIFPGAILQAWHLNVSGSATTNGSNINLDGTIQSNNAVVTADNINAASYVAGGPNGSNGFRIMANSASGTSPATDGSLMLNVAGNVNNPQGAAEAGQPASAFQYNGVPVTVFGGNGTSYISVMPTNTANAPQMVNLLVNGSAILGNSGVINAGSSFGLGGSIVPASSYPNSHLVVSATGNLTFGSSLGNNGFWSKESRYSTSTAPYYWPGLMVFSNITSAADPTSVGLGTMTLESSLSNLLPTNVSGNGGIFFNTNGLIAGLSSTNYVLTNSNSWINFPAGSQGSLIAAQYSSNNATNMDFYGATTNANASSLMTSQVLPASDIVSR